MIKLIKRKESLEINNYLKQYILAIQKIVYEDSSDWELEEINTYFDFSEEDMKQKVSTSNYFNNIIITLPEINIESYINLISKKIQDLIINLKFDYLIFI